MPYFMEPDDLHCEDCWEYLEDYVGRAMCQRCESRLLDALALEICGKGDKTEWAQKRIGRIANLIR